ncbi:MAG TPA: hypothetical protein VG963_06510, partial [Polyangiaceae bacterium]|nr:hypothetical protein [Polyangiaceae bacterium]
VRDEWLRALAARQPSRAFAVMRRTGILEVTYPELALLDEALFAHALTALDASPRDACLRLAALLWPLRGDLGAIANWLTRYRFTNQERARIVRMLEHAAPAACATWRDADLRRFAQRVGRGFIAEVAALGVAVTRAYAGPESEPARAAGALADRLAQVVGSETPLTPAELALGGRELMEALALAPGPRVGQLLAALLERVLEEPSLNTRAQLLAAARELTGTATAKE